MAEAVAAELRIFTQIGVDFYREICYSMEKLRRFFPASHGKSVSLRTMQNRGVFRLGKYNGFYADPGLLV